ncbi:hypothetical protein JD844_014922 [Phrynosoma platyrhinos]|uniref:Uncharacterized protein n=1 Tax=Phrynosoma platyrhinos TaxID=52577 RepID=A0ABQ7T6U6_PHRPL|nr:hypothetical protein JD844_014922 [Phrynosoma platyrhinos]
MPFCPVAAPVGPKEVCKHEPLWATGLRFPLPKYSLRKACKKGPRMAQPDGSSLPEDKKLREVSPIDGSQLESSVDSIPPPVNPRLCFEVINKRLVCLLLLVTTDQIENLHRRFKQLSGDQPTIR